MRPLRAALLAAVLLPPLGCHRLLPGSARCPNAGGTPWRELRSRHFVVDTDLEPAAAARLVADLERIQALVTVALAGGPREVPGYVRVVAPATTGAFQAIAPSFSLAYFTVSFLGEPTVVLHPEQLRKDPEIIAHELAHHFSWYVFPRQPLWFAEGLAQFVQTVASDTKGYANAAGVVPRMRAGELRWSDQVRARSLLAWRGEGDGGRYELWAWVLYHWLWNERPKQLADFQRRLALCESPPAAWLAAFPDLDPADPKAMKALDAALARHLEKGELTYYQVQAESDPSFTEAPLPAADVHVLLAEPRGFPALELKAALADDPTHPVALWLRTPADPPERRVEALRLSAAAHPGDWRAWSRLGDALRKGDAAQREAAYRKAIELNPGVAHPYNELAWSLAERGRPADALPFARRAVELRPSRPEYLDTFARIASDLGACEEALSLERRAVDLASASRGEPLRERLKQLEDRCGTGAGAAAAR